MSNLPQCAECPNKLCDEEKYLPDKLPLFCPMRNMKDAISGSKDRYMRPLIKRLSRNSALVEKEGYLIWPRLRETIEFAKRMDVKKIGIAFCIGLAEETKRIVKILELNGFYVASVCCKVGSIDKSFIEISDEDKLVRPFEAMCNPIAQAEILNRVGTGLNIVVGLCVGHDSLFYMHSKAPVTTLITKDRVTGHNPVIVLFSSYHKDLPIPSKKSE